MNGFLTWWLFELGRMTLFLTATALLVSVALRFSRLRTPTLHRTAWCLVLLVGWLFVRMPISIPWYDSAPVVVEKEVAIHAPAEATPLAAPAPMVALAESPTSDVQPNPSQATGLTAVEHDIYEEKATEQAAEELVPLSTVESPQQESAFQPESPIEPLLSAATPTSATAATVAEGGTFPIPWSVVLLSVWSLGIAITLLRWLLGYVGSIRSMSTALEPDEASCRQWRQLLKDHRIDREIPLRLTEKMGPLLCRWPDGYELVIPAKLWESLDPAVRLSVLRHELAHYQRGDVWKSLLIRILALPHWFNPAAWWAVRRFEEAAEWACDEAAVRDDIRSTDYARTLLSLAESSLAAGSCHPSMSRLSLTTRVRRLISFHDRKDSIMKKTTLATLAILLLVLCLVRIDLVAKPPTVAEKPAQEVTAEENLVEEDLVTDNHAAGTLDIRGSIVLDEDSKPAPSKKTYRYDGKTFQEWKDILETETSPERLGAAIDALMAIGMRGDMQATAEALVRLTRFYGSNDPYAITRKVHYFIQGRNSTSQYRMPYEVSIPILCRELEEGNEKSCPFAINELRELLSKLQNQSRTTPARKSETEALQKMIVSAFVKYVKSDAPKSSRLNLLATLAGQANGPYSKMISEIRTELKKRGEDTGKIFNPSLPAPRPDTWGRGYIGHATINVPQPVPESTLFVDPPTLSLGLPARVPAYSPARKPASKASVGLVNSESMPDAETSGELIVTFFVKSKKSEPLTDVEVEFIVSPAVKILAASRGFRRGLTKHGKSIRRIYWNLETLQPGVKKQFQVKCKNTTGETFAICHIKASNDKGTFGEDDFLFNIPVPRIPNIPPDELSPLEDALAIAEALKPTAATKSKLPKPSPKPPTVLPNVPGKTLAIFSGGTITTPDGAVSYGKEGYAVHHPDRPKDKNYRIEPPDVLQIELNNLVPKGPYRFETYDVIQIDVTNTPKNFPIKEYFLIEAEGNVNLGPAYGRVQVVGMTAGKAEAAIKKHLNKILKDPKVSVILRRASGMPPITGAYLVGPDGTIDLRRYGQIRVADKTIAEATQLVQEHLSKFLQSPKVSIEVGTAYSKHYYLVHGDKYGDIRQVQMVGNETILDAIYILPKFDPSTTKIRIARPNNDGTGAKEIDIDLKQILALGGFDPTENHRLFPNDRVIVLRDGAPESFTKEKLPREGAMTTLPGYRIEPPDLIQIEATKLVPIKTQIVSGDILQFNSINTLNNRPIHGSHTVDTEGYVDLGKPYGKVKVAGMSIPKAEKAVTKHLGTIVKNPKVSIELAKSPSVQPLTGAFLVGPDGTVNLRTYGVVSVAGMTTKEAKKTIEKQLSKTLVDPDVSVSVLGFNSKVYYVIHRDEKMGDNVLTLPITGRETVLDALSRAQLADRNIVDLAKLRVHLVRSTTDKIFEKHRPVDYMAIITGRDITTNYQILPGDRVYVGMPKDGGGPYRKSNP